jgi:membrane protein
MLVKVVSLARTTIEAFGRNDGTVLAAAIAYYTLLSIFPLILGLLALLGIFFSDPAVREEFVAAVAGLFPGSGPLIQQTVDQVVAGRGAAGFVATLGLIWGGSGVFGSISLAMDRIWQVDQTRNPILTTVRAVALVPAVAVVFVASLLLSATLRVAGDLGVPVLGTNLASLPLLFPVLGFALPLVITFGIFCLVYGLMPDRVLLWHQIWPGALLASVLFEAGKQIFAWYLGAFAHYNTVYGSIGAVIALVTWAFFAAILLLIGAQLNAVLSEDVLPRLDATTDPPPSPHHRAD